MITYSKEIVSKEGYIYSLDMIRINYEFSDKVQEFLNWLSMYEETSDNFEIKHWLSIKEFTYRDMFQIKTDEYSFALAIGFNGCNKDRNKGYIEFNPNKCKGYHFEAVWLSILKYTLSSMVVRFDLAIDMPLPRYLVKLMKDNRNYVYMVNKGSTTEYLGQRSNVGYVKLYDKTKEAKLDYNLTRLEITCDLEGVRMPSVKIIPLQPELEFTKLNCTEKVLIQLLNNSDNPGMYLKQLNKKRRKFLEKFIFNDEIVLDEKAYEKIYRQVIEYQY